MRCSFFIIIIIITSQTSVSSMIDKKSRQVRGGSRNLLKVAKDGDFEKVMFMLIDGLDPNVAQDDGPKGEKKVCRSGSQLLNMRLGIMVSP